MFDLDSTAVVTIDELSSLTTAPTVEAPRKRGGGPRTPEGKRASSRNALRDGYRSKVVLPENMERAYAARKIDFAAQFAPASTYESVLVDTLARTSVQLERCAEEGLADLKRIINQAETSWDDDRRAKVNELAERLAKHPERISYILKSSKHGVDWLIDAGPGWAVRSRNMAV